MKKGNSLEYCLKKKTNKFWYVHKLESTQQGRLSKRIRIQNTDYTIAGAQEKLVLNSAKCG
jgi:hypothetical protein